METMPILPYEGETITMTNPVTGITITVPVTELENAIKTSK